MRIAGVDAFGQVAADAVRAAADAVEILAARQADAEGEGIDRKPRAADDLREAFPLREAFFRGGFVFHGSRVRDRAGALKRRTRIIAARFTEGSGKPDKE